MFKLHSKYKPTGDQPEAIKKLVDGMNKGLDYQTLLGVTGSGKTFTIANVIEQVQKPTIVMAHNKTLAGQLYSEFKEMFPENAVEYFVSYYDYYQPEAYISSTDTYIEKDSSINDEIDKLRHSATAALFERKDVIIIASVSAIYSLGSPEDYSSMVLSIRPGMKKSRDELIRGLVEMQYERNDIDFSRGKFRVKGDIVDVFPAGSSNEVLRIELFGEEIEKISILDSITFKVVSTSKHEFIYPKSHYVIQKDKIDGAIVKIEKELEGRLKYFRDNDKIVEAYRLEQRTNFDIEMLRETGFCQGIENYSLYMSGRERGSVPYTLFDYLGDDFLVVIDESHATIPQIRAMYNGDRARKESLIENGFRLESAYDNRPLKFDEWEKKIQQTIFVSATPSDYEKEKSKTIAEQIIRPTGLIDPEVIVKPRENQIDDLLKNIVEVTSRGERALVITLTKKQAEELSSFLSKKGIKVNYMHSDIKALERLEIIRNLRLGKFDVLVGINLLREGLDIPEVSLVAILDADKEGFLRSERSLIQIIGRAARNSNGIVIMYADGLTNSIERAISETNRRRKIQKQYNEENNIVPQSIKKDVFSSIKATFSEEEQAKINIDDTQNVDQTIERLTEEMMSYARKYEFEKAATIRDFIEELKNI
ncbi:MAG: excinuclease ABC subunit UvrB [Clostridia bacterium]|nr:excinuclease ABC subunit UvrB [Clostridia bacterium]MDD4387485.1 excinuclease ABC subunit UvrB [Clostridia bacterium]